MDVPLCGTHLTGNGIRNLLSNRSNIKFGDFTISGVDAKVLGDQGYTSTVMRVCLTWSQLEEDNINDHSPPIPPKSVVIKALGNAGFDTFSDPSLREQLEKLRADILLAHNVECTIYTLDELADHIPMARCYAAVKDSAQGPGLLILEDLTERATVIARTKVFGDSVNSDQLENLLDVLTTLHAWSLNTSTTWQNHVGSMAKNPVMGTFIDNVRMSLPLATTQYPDLFKAVEEAKLQPLLTSESYLEIFAADPRKRYNMPLVLVHGDVQPLNMLFEKNADGEAGDRIVALLDWQGAHQGCGAEDVARVLGWVVSTKIRKQMGDQIVERYVEVRRPLS